MTPRWPLTPNSWTPVLFPPPQPDDHCIEILQKSIKAYSRSSILWFWTHRQIHACHKLSKFSLSPFALPPPKFWCLCHHCYFLLIKVGVNHGIFHFYHFWNFLIFKCTWVCSSSSSKNKNIFLNLSINSINLKMSIYLSISKMCSSLFRGEIKLARV